MDMSFANQALCVEHLVENSKTLEKKVYNVPVNVDMFVAELKLDSLGVKIDKLTPQQKSYLHSWELGT
jgi:adenosylhomocysteinase